MKILDRHLAARLTSTLIKTMVSLILLFVLLDLLTHRRGDIMKYDVPWHITAHYYLSLIPWILGQIAPLAMLVSALLVLGAAAQHSEVTAALSGGVSLYRLVRAPALIALALALLTLGVQESLAPVSTRTARRLETKYFSPNPSAERSSVSWANLSGGWTCHVAKFNSVALTGEGVLMYRMQAEALEQIQVRRVFWDPQRSAWVLEDGLWATFDPGVEHVRTRRVTQTAAPIREPPRDLFALSQPQDTKTSWQLASEIRRAEAREMPVKRFRVDYHAKFSQPALSFVMIWLAVPFAIRLRRGGIAIGFGLSVAIAIVYLTTFWGSMTLGYMGRLSPVAAAWFANAVFGTAGLALLLKTPT